MSGDNKQKTTTYLYIHTIYLYWILLAILLLLCILLYTFIKIEEIHKLSYCKLVSVFTFTNIYMYVLHVEVMGQWLKHLIFRF